MIWFLSILGLAALLGLVAATIWAVREMLRSTSGTRLERRLNPRDVLELDQAFARIQRDVLFGD
jgi:ABC-type proline/glycine betaine transport system permease subunit